MPSVAKIIINFDTEVKDEMKQIAQDSGFGTISSYVRTLVIQDIRRRRTAKSTNVQDLLNAIQAAANTSDATDDESMKLAIEGQEWTRKHS